MRTSSPSPTVQRSTSRSMETWKVGLTRRPDAQAPAGGVSFEPARTSPAGSGWCSAAARSTARRSSARTPSPRPTSHIIRASLSTYDAHPQLYGLGWNVETDHLGFLRWSHSGAFSSGASTTTVLLAAGAPRDRRADERDAAGRAGDRRRRDPQADRPRHAGPGLALVLVRALLRLLPGVRADRAGRPDPGPRRRRLPRHLRERLLRRGLGRQRGRRAGAGPRDTAGSRCR